MSEYIYDPLADYVNVFKDKFKAVCESTFAQLAAESDVDAENNRRICAHIEETEREIARLKKELSLWVIPRAILWILFAAGILLAIYCFLNYQVNGGIAVAIASLLLLWFILGLVYPKLRDLKEELDKKTALRTDLYTTAWEGMEPLNRLYDWGIFTRMMMQTVPTLEFDPFFTTQRLADLKEVYGWDEAFNAERSVLFSHSGVINGNPFVICRTKKMEWGYREYTGQLTINWTETIRNSNGKYHSRLRSETLTATITRPYPEYHKKTRLIYGNTAAPDLTFNRTQNDAKSKSRMGRWLKKNSLKRKSRNFRDYDYAMMSNEDFEVAFDTSNRNNNQQFALLFTPMAQNNMMSLLNDSEEGYGDNFDFEKSHMINVLIADHMQDLNIDMNPTQYRNYNFDCASEAFVRINTEYFRSLYFAFAPLLAVPLYQQLRPQESIYGHDMKRESSYWEHETLANFWGVEKFKHPDCVTDCILKTEKLTSDSEDESEATIRVKAHGFSAVPRTYYVKVLGKDGCYHQVPVHWNEYLPVTGVGTFDIKEDIHDATQETSQTTRIDRIHSLLQETGHSLYRRNITSRCN
ncbi:MAG: hypothetical protein K2I48_01635 [Muribaculaceae bacterium]|nr:hypothetical protein [Muribaculaceae bacterium]